MAFKDGKVWAFWKEYGKHIEALGILIALVLVLTAVYNDRNLKKEISENCGWGEEDYYCYCEKSESMAIKNKMEGVDLSLNWSGEYLSSEGLDTSALRVG